ncbi:phage tail tape measure protein [Sulfitobacter dubius]|uniref:Chromosome partition protein Smc n=1 Tax=Sulfitobacter dubius TaxID=218673 RepID=A0ABY3ZK87_9RHOB|nr:hypothetical protein [Sulfitobacter dubius]UOA14535.1 Chromosome partition protein Smc [Sulfitobacter dubius]
MTDFATLVLGANTSGLLKAKTDLAAVTSAGAKTEAGIKKSMAGIEGAVKSVPMAAKEAAVGMNSLRLSLDPLYASSKQYEAAQKQVTAAVRLGATSQAEANRIIKLAEAKYLGVGNAAQMAAKQMGGNGGFAHQSRMAAMQLSQVAQQTTATGDFVRALAIQLPDLALGFGAVGIGIGVVAGALLPMAANLITGGDNAKEFEEAMDSLSQASYDYTNAADQARKSVAELALEFGSVAEEAKLAFELFQGVNLTKALDRLDVALGMLDFTELERFAQIISDGPAELEVLNDTYNKALAGLKEQFGVTGEQAVLLREHLNDIRTAEGPEEIVRTIHRLNQYLIDAFGSAENIPPELSMMVERLAEAETAAGRITARLDGSADSANTAANAASNLSGQLSVAAQYAAQLAANLAMAPAGIQGFQNKAEQLTAQIAALDAGLGQITASAAGYRKELEQKYGLAEAANEAERAYISGVINRQVKEYTNVQNLNQAYTDRITAINKAESAAASASKKSASAAKKAMKDAAREAERFAKEVERLEFDADPLRKYNEELERLEYLVSDHGLSNGAFQKAVKDLNEELVNSNPTIAKVGDAIGDFVANGMRDFGDLLDSFKNMLKEMIATAIANPIKLSLMGVGGGMAGTAAQAAGEATGGGMGSLLGMGGGGGIMGTFMGGLAGGGTGFIGGAANVISSFGAGGFGSAFASIGHSIGAATTGIGAMGAAIGAIAVPVLAVAAVFSFFKKKTKELDSGLRVTVDGMDSLLESFRYVEESRFWGLSKKKKTYYDELAEEDAAPLEKVIHDLQTGILTTAEALSVGAGAFEAFSYQMKISTKDMSEEEAQAAIIEALQGLSDEFAGMVPGIADLQREGEGAATTLQRIVTELQTVNDALYLFDRAALEASVSGAAMASNLVELTGGLEAFTAKTQYVFANMLTGAAQEARLIEMAGDDLRDTFGDLSMAIPSTHAQFMALLHAQDLTTQGGRETYAALMDVAGAFVTVNGTAQSVVDAANAIADAQRTERIGLENELLQLNGETAELRRREMEALDPTNRALQKAIYRFEDMQDALAEFDAATADHIQSLRDKYAAANEALKDQLSDVDAQISAAKAAAEAFYDQRAAEIDAQLDKTVSRLDRAVDAASDALSALEGNLSAIRDAIASRGPIGAAQEASSYRNAQAALRSFASGASYTPDQLEAALSGIGGSDPLMFGNLQEMQIDAAETTATLVELEAKAADQVTVAERHLAAQEYSIVQAELAAERDKEFYKDQLDALDDVESIYRSMDQALAAVQQLTARREDISRLITSNDLALEREINQFSLLRSETRQQIEATYSVRDAVAVLTGALTGGAEQAFAKGGVVSGATRMIMQGGMGEMAEAGAEAIMPLKRGPGGRLGVEMYRAPVAARPAPRADTSRTDALIAEVIFLRREVVTLLKEVKQSAQVTAKSTENLDRLGTKARG